MSINKISFFILLSLTLTAVHAAALQVNIRQTDPCEHPEIVVFADVTDDAGQVVRGLDAKCFSLTEDGAAVRKLTLDRKKEKGRSLSVALAIDRSGSMMGDALPKAKEAAKKFIGRLKKEDRVAVLSFDHKVDTLQSLTTDKAAASAAVDGIKLGGDTALYSAAFEAVQLVSQQQAPQVVVLLTDGRDDMALHKNLNPKSLDQALEAARRKNVPLYTLGLGSKIAEDELNKLAGQSGGRFFPAPSPDDLARVYEAINDLLTNQYILRFTSDDELGAWNELTLKVKKDGASAEDTKKYWAVRKNCQKKDDQGEPVGPAPPPPPPPAGQSSVPYYILAGMGALLSVLIIVIVILLLRRKNTPQVALEMQDTGHASIPSPLHSIHRESPPEKPTETLEIPDMDEDPGSSDEQQ